MKKYFLLLPFFFASFIACTQQWNEAPSLQLQLPSHSSKAAQNGVALDCKIGISYDIFRHSMDTTPIYHVESDENSNPKIIHSENNHSWEYYRFVKPALYYIKLTNTSQHNNLRAGFIGYDYRYRYIRDVHYSEANEYFDLMNFHQFVGKGETASHTLDLNYFPEIPKTSDNNPNDKLISFIVGGGSGHYEVKNQFFDIWYPFDTESTTKMALKTYFQTVNTVWKYVVRDRENNAKTVTFELNTSLNDKVGSYRILAENGLYTQEDWLLVPKLTSGRNHWFKINCNAAFLDPKQPSKKYVYDITNSENYCKTSSDCMNFSQNSFYFENIASSTTVVITSKGEWFASNIPKWLRMSPISGKGKTTATITTFDNNETIVKKGSITISNYFCTYSNTLEITQAAADL
jgi:hypothetical protein